MVGFEREAKTKDFIHRLWKRTVYVHYISLPCKPTEMEVEEPAPSGLVPEIIRSEQLFLVKGFPYGSRIWGHASMEIEVASLAKPTISQKHKSDICFKNDSPTR